VGGPLSREHMLVQWCELAVPFCLFPSFVGDGENAVDGVWGSCTGMGGLHGGGLGVRDGFVAMEEGACHGSNLSNWVDIEGVEGNVLVI
jgi:hypothetical protein